MDLTIEELERIIAAKKKEAGSEDCNNDDATMQ